MPTEPKEIYPDAPVRELNIKCKQQSSGTWVIDCPEWKCQYPTGDNLTKGLAMLAAEVEEVNAEYDAGDQRFELEKAISPSIKTRGCKHYSTTLPPDDGKRTPVHAVWQRAC